MAKLQFFKKAKYPLGRKGFNKHIKKHPPKNEEERRQLEMEYLKPAPLPDPTKDRSFTKPRNKINMETYLNKILIYFHNKEDYELFRKYIKVNDYVEVNSYDVELIVKLFKAIDSGKIKVEEL